MHEASLVKALLRQVEELANAHNAVGVKQVNVVIGEFSGVEPDLLESAFYRQTPGTSASGARICVERAQLMGVCGQCSTEFQIEQFNFQCQCGSKDVTVTGGEELMLDSVIMETT